jgi:thiamine pyrophosphokinase
LLLALVPLRTGLHWDLQEFLMRVGGMISTSNLLSKPLIWVETDSHLVWTTKVSAL